jgi:hypothetical protein
VYVIDFPFFQLLPDEVIQANRTVPFAAQADKAVFRRKIDASRIPNITTLVFI